MLFGRFFMRKQYSLWQVVRPSHLIVYAFVSPSEPSISVSHYKELIE